MLSWAPDLAPIDWGILDYLGWIHPSGSTAFVVMPVADELRGLRLRRVLNTSARPRPVCARGVIMFIAAGTALFGVYVSGSTVGAASAITSAVISTAVYASVIWCPIRPPTCQRRYTSNQNQALGKFRSHLHVASQRVGLSELKAPNRLFSTFRRLSWKNAPFAVQCLPLAAWPTQIIAANHALPLS